MKPLRCVLGIFAFAVPLLATAAAQRTFVASTGADSNPCSINLPCRSFATAIAQTLAGGEVIVQDSAGYGTVTISKSVSILAPPGIYAGISVPAGQNGVTVNGSSIVVVLRGLSINGIGGVNGIQFVQGARLRVQGCVVSNVAGSGILLQASGSETLLVDTIVRDNAQTGVAVTTDASAVLESVKVQHNGGDGLFVLAVASKATATIRDSVFSHNGQGGIAAVRGNSAASTEVMVETSSISNNGGDGLFIGGITDGYVHVSVSRSAIAHNGLSGVSVFDGTGSGGLVLATLIGNRFHNNGSAVKVDGASAHSLLSANTFVQLVGLITVNGGVQETYQDNTGFPGGPAPTPAAYF